MRSLLFAVRLELRRSPMLLATPLLAFLGGLSAWRSLTSGVLVWDNAMTSIVGSVQLMGPVAAGLAAWAAGRERRRGVGHLRVLGARDPAAAPLVQLLALSLWALASFASVALVVVVRFGLGTAHGQPSATPVAAAGLALLVHVAVGYAAGLLWPRVIVPPLVAAGAYLAAGWNMSRVGTWHYLLFPVTVDEADAFSTWQPQLFVRQALWFIALIALVAAVIALVLSPRGRLTILVVSVALATGVFGIRLADLGGRFFANATPAFEYRCVQTPVRVCVHPAYQRTLPALAQAPCPGRGPAAGNARRGHHGQAGVMGTGFRASTACLVLSP